MVDNFRDSLEKKRGYEQAAKKEKQVEERKAKANRLWLPPEEGTRIIFLDDNPPVIDEHQLKLNGHWRNWFTCLREFGDACPICDIAQDNPYAVGFYTVIDGAEYTDSSGKTWKNQKRLLPAKLKSLKMLKHQSSKRDGLTYAVYDIYRSSADAVNVGDTYDFEGFLEKEKILKLPQVEDLEPFDYAEILAPKDPATLKQILQGNAAAFEESAEEGGQIDDSYDEDDYEIDF